MRTLISFQNKNIPVYVTEQNNKKALDKLGEVLNRKLLTGKNALKSCILSLISVEITGSEATLHTINEKDTLTISLY
ncbi:3-dehydroquinate dehydratase [Paenibacillus pasadenensis]|uniref:3-dehydroquinate dehydratase n=1 Tax=Paenibacillus pasadenensis TaxID=217090 RepID=UPI00203BA33F|nr:3-dehydroquinate dehydratase [Paenibacillus pasadenensis]MCM3748280.1 3-dehydroquinate dehydratase [Paenibacillus pasadenensis]